MSENTEIRTEAETAATENAAETVPAEPAAAEKAAPETAGKKKKSGTGKKILLAAAGVLVCACTATSAVFAGMSYAMMKSYMGSEDDMDYSDGGPTREDDVSIMDEYTIRSTTRISDAYKSGDTSALSSEDQETLELASTVLDVIITDGMTDFEKETAVYDWVCANINTDGSNMTVIPNTGIEEDNPHDVLKYHTAVCVGYATTFRLLMQMMDIDCMVVHNSECYHSWDLVKLDDHWYHVDCYSDQGSGTYANFNLNDSMMMMSEDWDTSFYPEADSMTYNMAYRNLKTIDSIYDLPQTVRDAIDNDTYTLCIKVSNMNDSDMAIGDYILSQLDNQLSWVDTADFSVYFNSYGWTVDEDGSDMMYIMMVNTGSDSIDYDLDEDAELKADEAISNAFGDALDTAYYDEVYTGDDCEWAEYE